MKKTLHILHLEDNPLDAELVHSCFEESDLAYTFSLVDTEEDFVRGLTENAYDLVLADFNLPTFDGLSALKILRSKNPFLPFIFVTGTMGDEIATQALKTGATDYILKDNLSRLLPAVDRALRETEERKRRHLAEMETRASEKRYRDLSGQFNALLDALPDAIILLSSDLKVMWSNKTATAAIADKQKNIHEHCCFELWQERSRPCDDCAVKRCFASGEIETGTLFLGKQGIVWEVRAIPLKDEGGNVTRVLEAARDVTQHRQLEHQLRQAQKMEAIGTLAGGIAHDFNNILTPIIGYTEIALRISGKDSPLFSDLQQVLDASNRAKDLVQQILSFSRQKEKEILPVQAQLIVKEALKLLRASLPTSIEIRTDLHSNAKVNADPTGIHQIIMNLCTNAAHAMESSPGILSVSLADITITTPLADHNATIAPGEYLQMIIADTGSGMDKDILDRIFDPYFTTKDVGEGTGLGLAVVKGIVENYGGMITVESEPGSGTTFTLYLPRIEAEKETAEEEKTHQSFAGSEHILVVDDEAVIVALNKKRLAKYGYKITAKVASTQALQSFQDAPDSFDLVITDLTMPKLSGLGLIEKILGIRENMPIIVCTGYSSTEKIEDIEKMGVKNILLKPINNHDLLQMTRHVLDEQKK